MTTVKITDEQRAVILHALRCMDEHVQYEDEWSDDEREKARDAYQSARQAIIT